MGSLRMGMLCICLACMDGMVVAQPVSKGRQDPATAKTARQLAANRRKPTGKANASDAFFARGSIPHLRIEIVPAELQLLRENNRAYVRCQLTENGSASFMSVGIKLKGAAGSFRELDDRPAFTINMDRFTKGLLFHDIEKFHLNNSVQDESYLNELLCAELFLKAGIPAPRVTHARVWLNGRDVGLYVLKEGFDKRFLKRHFVNPDGNLYDGGFVQDIDVDLEKDAGSGPDDRSDLHALNQACSEPDPKIRWQKIEKLLNVEQFITFMALELMTCHWDGYTLNKNNYRIYFDPEQGKAHFLPHGMDQMFGDPGFPVLDYPGCIVSSAVMHNPIWRQAYRDRLKELLPLFSPPERLLQRLDIVRNRLTPIVKDMGEQQLQSFQSRVDETRDRLIERAKQLVELVDGNEPDPLEFNEQGLAAVTDWYSAAESDAVHEQLDVTSRAKKTIHTSSIKANPESDCIASWRRKVLLRQGRYELIARAKVENVVPIEDERGIGVGLRISGASRKNKLTGTQDWAQLRFEFEVLEEIREVELVAEIRAKSGQVWFDTDAFQLRRLEK